MTMNSRKHWLALIVLCLGDLMIVLDVTIVGVALPSIREDLGFSEPSLAWVVNAYLLTFGGFLLLGGRLGDLFGHRRLFLAGIALFKRLVMTASPAATLLALLLLALGGCGTEQAAPSPGLDRQLIEAARIGDSSEVESSLSRGARVEERDENGATALVAAAYGNHVAACRLLIEAGADVNAADETEQSAYLIATSEVGDDPRLLELTLENGADVGTRDSYNGTGLIRAAERGHVAIVRLLLETPVALDHVNRLGWTALLEAIVLGEGGEPHTEVVRLLVEAGADVDIADGAGVTPLAHARERRFTGIVALLEGAPGR